MKDPIAFWSRSCTLKEGLEGRANKETGVANLKTGIATILIILLVLALIGVLPTWGYSSSWGYAPGGLVGLLLLVIIILALSGRL
jgi:hypothetical protein